MSFGLAALGQAYQDAQANTYIAQVGEKAHRWLGVVYASYSVGCLVGPLAVTGISSVQPDHWVNSYGALAGVAGLNVCLVVWAFVEDLFIHRQNEVEDDDFIETQGEERGENDCAGRATVMWKEVREVLREKSVWLISLSFSSISAVA